jgi:hypothetical protein
MYFISMLWLRTSEDKLYFYALVEKIWRLVDTFW